MGFVSFFGSDSTLFREAEVFSSNVSDVLEAKLTSCQFVEEEGMDKFDTFGIPAFHN